MLSRLDQEGTEAQPSESWWQQERGWLDTITLGNNHSMAQRGEGGEEEGAVSVHEGPALFFSGLKKREVFRALRCTPRDCFLLVTATPFLSLSGKQDGYTPFPPLPQRCATANPAQLLAKPSLYL